MSQSTATTAETLLEEFDSPWRDDTPVFGCCRKAVATAVENVDPMAIVPLDVTTRVRSLRHAVDQEMPGHLDSHRCCSNHLADLAFDLPALLAPVGAGAE